MRFHTGAFTNLTRDHLDYHKTMTAYGEAKAKLFEFPDLKHVVVNIGDVFGRQFSRRAEPRACNRRLDRRGPVRLAHRPHIARHASSRGSHGISLTLTAVSATSL